MTRLVRNIIILSGAPSRQASFKKDYDVLQEKMAAATEHLDRLLITQQGRVLMDKVRKTGSLYVSFSDDLAALGMQKKPGEATDLLFGPRFQTQLDYQQALKNMVAFQESQMQKAGASALKERQSALILFSLQSVTAVLLATLRAGSSRAASSVRLIRRWMRRRVSRGET